MTDNEAVKRMKELREYFREKCVQDGPDVGCEKCDMLDSKHTCYDGGYKMLSGIIEHLEKDKKLTRVPCEHIGSEAFDWRGKCLIDVEDNVLCPHKDRQYRCPHYEPETSIPPKGNGCVI